MRCATTSPTPGTQLREYQRQEEVGPHDEQEDCQHDAEYAEFLEWNAGSVHDKGSVVSLPIDRQGAEWS